MFTRLFHISKWQHNRRLGRIRRWKHCSYSTKFGSSREQRPWHMRTKAYIVELYYLGPIETSVYIFWKCWHCMAKDWPSVLNCLMNCNQESLIADNRHCLQKWLVARSLQKHIDSLSPGNIYKQTYTIIPFHAERLICWNWIDMLH